MNLYTFGSLSVTSVGELFMIVRLRTNIGQVWGNLINAHLDVLIMLRTGQIEIRNLLFMHVQVNLGI